MAVKATPNPPGTAELVSRLEALQGVLYWDRPGMRLTDTIKAAVEELGGTQEALMRLLTLCVMLIPSGISDLDPDPRLFLCAHVMHLVCTFSPM